MAMFSWSNGEVWTASIPFRPALDVATGALFWLGFILVLSAYVRERHWLHLFLMLSIPLLMLPSTLALAFPIENPNLYRTAGAMVPAFLLVGISLDGLMTSLEERFKKTGTKLAWAIALILFVLSAGHGDFFRFVVAPGDSEEAFYLTGLSMNVAWKYQLPAIVLIDKEISEDTFNLEESIL